jgi:CubicO group peptidase (beta-lactamase class C family)
VSVDEVLDEAFADQPTAALVETHAVLAVQAGRVVAERYAEGVTAASTLISWSMAKSITQALVGFAVDDGLLDLHAPAPVPEWADDERSTITTDHLLRMCPGLAFREDYVDGSADVQTMLFGEAKADMAGYAASFPLVHEPGTVFNYSSGTTNLLARIVGQLYGGRPGVEALLRDRLFGPIGMTSATAKFDAAGTFIGSSYVYANARDFARFGELYLHGGQGPSGGVLPEAWVTYARTESPVPVAADEQPYGAHWWLFPAVAGSFAAQGYQGQRTLVVPDRDLVVVRLGRTPVELKPNLDAWLVRLVDALPRG